MAGSTFGNRISITTWGESHGAALGVVIDGFPAGLKLCEEDIQVYLDRRKPGQSKFTTARAEGDKVEILSGVFALSYLESLVLRYSHIRNLSEILEYLNLN